MLSDNHDVAAFVLLPIRDAPLYAQMPTPEPTTVTLVDDVTAVFIGIALLEPAASCVSEPASVFACQPVVSATRRCAQTPAVPFDETALSDNHNVTSPTVPPTREGLL